MLGGEPRTFARPLDAQQAGISTIYQEVNLVPLMSAAANVFLGREPRGPLGLVDNRTMERRARELLASYGVHIDVRRPLRTLGLGAQQMVALARAVSISARVVIMDEPTSSLEPREVATLFEVIARLREQGIAIVYVSHRMDELYQVCERVTVLRDGRLVHSGALVDLPRMELVSMMLGRDASAVRGGGATEFAEKDTTRTSEPLLVAEGLSRKHQIDGVGIDVRPGEVLGLGGLLGAGRSETLKAVAGAMPLDHGSVTIADRKVRSGSVPAAIRAGIVLLPEDRKAEGIIPNLSVRENIVLAALPRLSRFGFVSRKKQEAVVETMMRRLHVKASSPEQLVNRAVRRQPAEGDDRALAGDEPQGAAARRADPRDRRRRQGRGAGAHRRAGRRGPGDRPGLLRDRGGDRGRRPDGRAQGRCRGRGAERCRRHRGEPDGRPVHGRGPT